MRTVSLLIFGCAYAGWALLGFFVPSASERIYLLIPPTFLAAFLLFVPEARRKLRDQAVPGGLFVAVLVLACILMYARKIHSVIHNDSAAAYFHWDYVLPLLAMVYFLVGLCLLVALPVRGLRLLCQHLHRRGKPAESTPGRLASTVYSLIALTLIVPLLLPYLIGVTYVHRFKVPNAETPTELVGRTYEDVQFETVDDYTVRGWFLPHDVPSARTLLICHGLGANRTNFISFHELGRALAANILYFDFRCHGDSTGTTVSFGYWEKLDVLAAVKYLRGQRPEQARQIYALGISMGTSGLVRAAAEVEPPLDGIILDSPFASAVELTDRVLGAFPAFLRPYISALGVPVASLHAGCDLNQVRPVDNVANLRCPLLIVHANEDMLIPVEHARRMFAAAQEPKFLWIAPTGRHGSAWQARDQYITLVRAKVLR